MTKPLPYPPPWQDIATLCAHLCISEGTVDNWVKQGILPAGRMVGGKRMWKWSEVEAKLDPATGIVPEADLAARVYNATKQAANG
jgi:predicted site-specific integrase-resolvase